MKAYFLNIVAHAHDVDASFAVGTIHSVLFSDEKFTGRRRGTRWLLALRNAERPRITTG